MTSRRGRSGNRERRASPLDPEQDQGAGRRPVSRVGAGRIGGLVIGQSARRSVQLARDAHVLVIDVVVAPVADMSNPRRLTMRVLRRVVKSGRRAMRSSTDSSRAFGDIHDREREKDPESEADAERPQTGDPLLPPHARHPTTATGVSSSRPRIEPNSHSFVTTVDYRPPLDPPGPIARWWVRGRPKAGRVPHLGSPKTAVSGVVFSGSRAECRPAGCPAGVVLPGRAVTLVGHRDWPRQAALRLSCCTPNFGTAARQPSSAALR